MKVDIWRIISADIVDHICFGPGAISSIIKGKEKVKPDIFSSEESICYRSSIHILIRGDVECERIDLCVDGKDHFRLPVIDCVAFRVRHLLRNQYFVPDIMTIFLE